MMHELCNYICNGPTFSPDNAAAIRGNYCTVSRNLLQVESSSETCLIPLKEIKILFAFGNLWYFWKTELVFGYWVLFWVVKLERKFVVFWEYCGQDSLDIGSWFVSCFFKRRNNGPSRLQDGNTCNHFSSGSNILSNSYALLFLVFYFSEIQLHL